MRKSTQLLIVGLILLVLFPLLMRGVDILRPVLDANGQPLRLDNGRIVLQRDEMKTFLANWDAWACLLGGVVCTVLGTGLALKKEH